MKRHKHLTRLTNICVPHAVYFMTVCTHRRRSVLASDNVADVLVCEWREAYERHGWLIGRYVIMPDHVHFFCAERPGGATKTLSGFMNMWKEWTAKGAIRMGAGKAPFWQRQFFDHVLRHDESYAEKWSYVRENPVRAGLVETREDWPHQGFIDFDSPLGDALPRPACAATEERDTRTSGAWRMKCNL